MNGKFQTQVQILFIPFLELIFMGSLVSYPPEIRELMAVPPVTWYLQFAFSPLLIVVFVFLSFLDERQDLPEFVPRKSGIAVNLIAGLLLAVFFMNFMQIAAKISNSTALWLWYGSAALFFLSGFFIFFSPADLFTKLRKYPNESFYAAVAAMSLGVYLVADLYIWPYLAGPTTRTVDFLLRFSGLEMLPAPSAVQLKHPDFSAYIAATCSGMEGMGIFVFILSLLLIKTWKYFSKIQLLIIYTAGIFYMALLNILRIYLFFIFALWISYQSGQERASELFIWLFHEHIGWMFYFAGIGLFFVILFKLNKRKPKIV